ncbi:hypothetical protein ACFE04_025539 [Oxalis oulophora]
MDQQQQQVVVILIVLLLCCSGFNINVGASNHLKLSTKLIHIFSINEAKPMPMPKRNSFEYYQLLLTNDFNKHQFDLVKPSNGTTTFFFGNDFFWLHYTWIDIGTPNLSFLVALDAGSDLSWLPCDCIQCAPFSDILYTHYLDRGLSEYKPDASNTSKQLSCSHQLCDLSADCKSPKDPCPYVAEYQSQGTSSSGFLVQDELHLTSISEHTPQQSVKVPVILGCGRKQSGEYLNGAAPDGLMGLGPGGISIPSLLARKGITRDSFSICFNENNTGRILFGDLGPSSQQFTPFISTQGKYVAYLVQVDHPCVGSSCFNQLGFQALVDSGSSFTYLPTQVFNRIGLEFDKQINASRRNIESSTGFKYCYSVSSAELVDIPTLRFVFSMNQSFLIRSSTISVYSDGKESICLPLQPTDLDYENFMTGYNMVFNRENWTFGWSHSTCPDVGDKSRLHLNPPPDGGSPVPLPANEQQSTTNTTGVPPAFAGKSSSKSSAALFVLTPFVLYLRSSLLLLLVFLAHI